MWQRHRRPPVLQRFELAILRVGIENLSKLINHNAVTHRPGQGITRIVDSDSDPITTPLNDSRHGGYPQFVQLESKGIDAFENLCQWSPLTLELESTRWLGSPDFRYIYRFHKGSSPVSFERRGCFLSAHGQVLRIDSDTFNLIEAIDGFNDSSAENKTGKALLRFHEIKGLAGSIGAKLDKYLGAERVLLPSKLGVDIVPEDGGRISFVPKGRGSTRGWADLSRTF